MNKFEIGKSYTYKTAICGDVVTCKEIYGLDQCEHKILEIKAV